MTSGERVVVAGGTGSLGRRIVDRWAARGRQIVVLSRSPRTDPRPNVSFLLWDGATRGPWVSALEGCGIVVNLAGELVDRRPTKAGIELLTSSRVLPTKALVEASQSVDDPPGVWLQASTLAIHGDAGDRVISDGGGPADGPPQMAGVAAAWERAVEGAAAKRLVLIRSSIVLDPTAPAFRRLALLTRFGLGGRIGSGRQWVSWAHIGDWLDAIDHLADASTLSGPINVTSPNPVTNAELMAAFRDVHGRRWAPATPAFAIKLGAPIIGTDAALALTGRRCVPDALLDDGFEFRHPNLEQALTDLVSGEWA